MFKLVLNFSSHNPNAWDLTNYSIVEDLFQTPSVMSSLEMLHTYPAQRDALLYALGAHDLSILHVIKFETIDVKPLFPYYW